MGNYTSYIWNIVLYVQDVLPNFIYQELLYKMGQDFLDIKYIKYYLPF